ncbi:MAG: helix-turn-helix domain-containing protein [Candidatus Omnitrophica bacterium]|nr:helix-turn-helix domain-containing protein [Candidatus Omnitrophota bacterium]
MDNALNPSEKTSPKNYLSIPQYARELGLSRIAVYKKVKNGQLPAKKVGRHYVIFFEIKEAGRPSSRPEKVIQKEGYVSISEYAEQRGISRFTVHQRIRKGRIQAVKCGRNYMVSAKETVKKTTRPFKSVKNIKKVKDLTSISEYSRRIGLDRAHIYSQVKSGQIEGKKVGRNYILAKQTVGSKASAETITGRYIGIPQFAKILGISRIALYKQVKKGVIKGRKVGRNYVIAVEDIRLSFGDETARQVQKEVSDE